MSRLFSVYPYEAEPEKKYDLFIVALGFEKRAINISRKRNIFADRRVAPGFKDRQVLNYAANKKWLFENGFECADLEDDQFEKYFEGLLKDVRHQDEKPISLLIDISCFNRFRLAVMIDVICSNSTIPVGIHVDFLYSLGEFSPPPDHFSQNTLVGPVSSKFAGWTVDPLLPPAAVIGLGYEQGKALGAVDHLQISHVLACLPKSEITEYYSAVKTANSSLLDALASSYVFDYPVHDPASCFYMIESVVNGLSVDFNPILLPFGPKIFTVCALLVASQHKYSAVWRVSGGTSEDPCDRIASEYIIGLTAKFGSAIQVV